jgi:pimeloyl-ACP methyl ester carboxylesterase
VPYIAVFRYLHRDGKAKAVSVFLFFAFAPRCPARTKDFRVALVSRAKATLALILALGVAGCASTGTSTSDDANSDDAGVPHVPVNDAGAAPTDAGGWEADAAQTDTGSSDAALADFAVGVTTRTWVDTHRPTPQNGVEPAKTSRTLVTEIWYPTPGTSSAAPPARDAPLAPGGPYPLVLFVHGSSSSRTVYSYLTIGLARAGYVVAAADFPLTALSTPGGSSDLNVSDQVGDLSFLCDQLKAAALDPSDALAGAVDGLRYAVVGHSTGGAVAALAAFAGDDPAIKHDPRVSAIVPLSGDACMFDATFFKSRSVPVFAIGATNDLFVRLANSGQWVFDNTTSPHLLAKLVGGEHVHFTDLNLPDILLNPVPTGPTSPLATTLRAYGDAGACLPVPAAGTDPAMSFDTQHARVVELVTAYLEAQMRQRPAALAALVGGNDPVVVFQQ